MNNCYQYKIYEIVNKVLLARDKLMPEMDLKEPGFAYSVCGPFTKNKEGIYADRKYELYLQECS